MKKFRFFLFALIPFLSACDFSVANNQKQSEYNNQEETDQPEPPQYEKWNTKTVNDLVETLGIHTNYNVPAYDKCIEIEYDGDNALLDGYFGIYCKTEFEECEQLYTAILQENDWIIKDKMGGFCIGFSPDYALMVEYIYESNNRELVIYVTEGALVDWPSTLISEAIFELNENATSTIPEFEADYYQVNYYDWVGAVAINGFGADQNVVVEYKNLLEQNNWIVNLKSSDGTYGAVAPNKDLRIDFYYDVNRVEFNIDIFNYVEETNDWPEEKISSVVSSIEAEGTILPYLGENNGFNVEDYWEPPVVLIYVSFADTKKAADDYNQYLIDSGYVVYGTLYGEAVYYFPGTTLCYRAASLDEYVVTIEFMNINYQYIVKVE